MKIIFMGTPDFAVATLEKLDRKGYEIDLVITQKDRPRGRGKKIQYPAVKEAALELGLEVYQPDNVNDPKSIKKIKDLEPDFIIVVAFGQILSKEILEIPKYKCLNVHASLLPKYRGAAPINWAIINGEKETGITIMEMEEGLDSGDMYSKAIIEIEKDDNYMSLHDKLALKGARLLINTMEDIVNDNSHKEEQNHDESSYAPMIFKDTGRINWSKSGKSIVNLLRGLKPWPGIFTYYNDQILKIHEIEILPRFDHGENGQIIDVTKDGVFVNCKDSTIQIKELQFPNKRKMKVEEYLAGNKIEKGLILK